MIRCPNCGDIAKEQVELYDISLRRQNFAHTPIYPTCRSCHAPVQLLHRCDGGEAIVLTGTCGSGKSTVAELLVRQGFWSIDGDCALQAAKHRQSGAKLDYRQIADEIARELDWLSLYTDKFVLAAVIHPEDLLQYKALLKVRRLRYRFYLLKPDYAAALQRCQTRTCHKSVTPEYWIDYFYRLLNYDATVNVVDNTLLTAEETAAYILNSFYNPAWNAGELSIDIRLR